MTRIVFPSCRRLVWALALALSLPPSGALHAQRNPQGRNTAPVLAAFRNVVARPSESTVRVLCDRAETALGTVVSPDGFVVTKASDLKGKVACKLKDGKQFDARIVGIDEKTDLAMLKIDTSGLRPIEWRTAKPEVGDWVASASVTADPAAVGVVSVLARVPNGWEMGPAAPPPNSGFLGIQLDNNDRSGPVIVMVTKGSAADKAGLKTGDLVLTVAGKKVTDAPHLIATVQRFKAGEVVALKVRRGDGEKEFKVTLGKRPFDFNRGDRMNAMGSELSRKRTGFPIILQHDTVLKPRDCGGPLVDLDGKAVGINIARAGRTESYAIPADKVVALLADLKSGKLAPPREDADDVANLEGALEKLRGEVARTEADLKAFSEEADRKKKEAQDRLADLRKQLVEKQAALDKVRKDATKK